MENRKQKLGYNKLCMEGMAVDGEMAWFANTTFNGLFQLDLKSCRAKYLGMFPDEKARGVHLYSACYMFGEEILCVPFAAKKICVYNKINKKMTTFKVEDENGNVVNRFYITVQRGQYIYMLSFNKPYIICFDIVTKNIQKYGKWYQVFQKQYPEIRYMFFAWAEMLVDEEVIYIPCCSKNIIVRVELETEEVKLIIVNETINGINTICKRNDDYYITTTAGEIYSGRCEDGNWKSGKYIGTVEGGFCKSILFNHKIWFFPKESGNIYVFSPDGTSFGKVLDRDLDAGRIEEQAIKSYHQYNTDQTFMVLPTLENRCYVMLNDGFLYCIYKSHIQKLGKVECTYDVEPLQRLDFDRDGRFVFEKGSYIKNNILDNSFMAYCEYLCDGITADKTDYGYNVGKAIYKEVREKLQ